MSKGGTVDHLDEFWRKHPTLFAAAIGVLLIFVVFVELIATDAPLVLYQAF